MSSSLGRPSSSLRSRDKLPQIGNHTKLAKLDAYQQRLEHNVISKVAKVDKATLTDIYHVSLYCKEIQEHMQAIEKLTQPNGFYMRNQKDINENVRAILVDWIISVHAKFKLLPETLYLTINLIDRYFCIFNIRKSDVQLVGVAALLIGTKYEEIYPPTVKDFIYLTDNTYSRAQILSMEQSILFHLQFEIQQTSSYRFLERYSKIAKADSPTFYLAQYLLELALLDSKMNQYKPSLLASTAIYVSLRVQLSDSNRRRSSQTSVWTRDLVENTGYANNDLQNCAKNYFQLASLIQRSELQAILRKFTMPKYMEVARIMNVITAKHEAQAAAQASRQGDQVNSANASNTGTNSKHHMSRTHTTNSSNGKKRGASSSTGKIANISNMNSTSGSVKQMTAKNHKTSSSNAMSSAESKKI